MSNNKQIRFSFRKGLKSDLPTHAPLGEPLFCTDTGEIYVGMGETTSPKLANSQNNVINLNNYIGFVNSPNVDNTPIIQKALNTLEHLGGGTLIFPFKSIIKLTKQGTRAIKTWHSSAYSRMYSLLVPSNVEIDLNYCTLSVQPDPLTTGMVMAFENKNADNTLEGDHSISIKRGTIDFNMLYNGDYNTSNMGAYDRHGISLNNIDGLVLEDLKIVNTLGYGLYLCNTRNFKLLGDITIHNCMGCAFRLGWDDDTRLGYIQNLNIINNSEKYESWLPTNTLYMIAEDVTIDVLRQGFDDVERGKLDLNTKANMRSSSNFANGCNNITIDIYESDLLGIKIQNYTQSLDTAPDNIHINKLLLKNSFLNLQSKVCFIDKLIVENDGLLNNNLDNALVVNIWDSHYVNINYFYIKRGVVFFKSNYNLLGTTRINEWVLDNSCVGSTTSSGYLKVDSLKSIRTQNQGLNLNNTTKYILQYPVRVDIGLLDIYNDTTCDSKTSFISVSKGSTFSKIIGVSPDGKNFVNSFTINLTKGVSSTINLTNLANNERVYKNSNNMFFTFIITPINSSAREVNISNTQFTNYFDRLVLSHSNALGTEKFYITITQHLISETVDWEE